MTIELFKCSQGRIPRPRQTASRELKALKLLLKVLIESTSQIGLHKSQNCQIKTSHIFSHALYNPRLDPWKQSQSFLSYLSLKLIKWEVIESNSNQKLSPRVLIDFLRVPTEKIGLIECTIKIEGFNK